MLIDGRDVDLGRGTIAVRSCYTKTKKNRVIQIGEKLKSLLLEQGPRKSGRVFSKWKSGSVTNIFRRYTKECDLGRRISIHSLRHTATVHLILAGVDMFTVSKILGHASIKVTESVYAHVPESHKREAMDKLPFQSK